MADGAESLAEVEAPPAPRSGWRFIAFACALAGALIAYSFLPVSEWFDSFREWLQSLGWLGPIAFMFAYAILTVSMFPVILLSLSSAALFGYPVGLLSVIVGGNAGAFLSFILGRTILRRQVEEWAARHPRFRSLDYSVAESGFKIVLLMRFSPAFPFIVLNYLFGLTRISAGTYALATFLGMLPLNIAFTYLGYVAAQDHPSKWILRGVGLAATIAVSIILGRIAKRALKEVPAK